MASKGPLLLIGSVGDAVTTIQIIIQTKAGGNISINGIFDHHTETRIKDIQRFFGLNESGIVDASTWEVLEFLAEVIIPVNKPRILSDD